MKHFLAALSGLILSANAGLAATAETTMAVSATVQRSCTVSAGEIGFGVLTQGTNSDASASITITCTAGSANDAPSATFGLGANASGSQRRMAGGEAPLGGTAFVPYNLFSDSARVVPVTSSTLVSTTAASGGVSYSTTIYGRVPAAGDYQLGTYSDTVTVVVTYSTTAVLLPLNE